MLYRKISGYLEEYLKSENDKILIVEGARQIGKSFIIREVGKHVYKNFIEVNFVQDDEGPQLFKNIHDVNDFYFALSSVAGNQMHEYSDTLVFQDEIQHYPHSAYQVRTVNAASENDPTKAADFWNRFK